MSRSYKRTPRARDSKGKTKKRIANKIVRQWLKDHPDELLKPSDYKRIYETWDICDYNVYYSWEEYWNYAWERYNWDKIIGYKAKVPNKKETYRQWSKWYRNK